MMALHQLVSCGFDRSTREEQGLALLRQLTPACLGRLALLPSHAYADLSAVHVRLGCSPTVTMTLLLPIAMGNDIWLPRTRRSVPHRDPRGNGPSRRCAGATDDATVFPARSMNRAHEIPARRPSAEAKAAGGNQAVSKRVEVSRGAPRTAREA